MNARSMAAGIALSNAAAHSCAALCADAAGTNAVAIAAATRAEPTMRESVLMRLLLCGSELLMRLRAGIGSISLGSSTGIVSRGVV